jgi:hypothetical protein
MPQLFVYFQFYNEEQRKTHNPTSTGVPGHCVVLSLPNMVVAVGARDLLMIDSAIPLKKPSCGCRKFVGAAFRSKHGAHFLKSPGIQR